MNLQCRYCNDPVWDIHHDATESFTGEPLAVVLYTCGHWEHKTETELKEQDS